MHDEITQELEVRFPDEAGQRRAPEGPKPPAADRQPPSKDREDREPPPLPSRIRLRPSDLAGPLAVFGIGAFLLWMGLTQAIDRPWEEELIAPEELPRPVAAAPRTPELRIAPESAPAAPAPVAPAAIAPEPVEIQLLSGRSPDGADRARERLVREHGELLEGLSVRVVRADLGAQGVYFRVRAGSLASAEEARALCVALEARRQSCIVID